MATFLSNSLGLDVWEVIVFGSWIVGLAGAIGWTLGERLGGKDDPAMDPAAWYGVRLVGGLLGGAAVGLGVVLLIALIELFV
jgi:hypothetical protein